MCSTNGAAHDALHLNFITFFGASMNKRLSLLMLACATTWVSANARIQRQ